MLRLSASASSATLIVLLAASLDAAGCAGAPRSGSPPGPNARAAGCPIEVVEDGVPARPTRDSSQVVARCRGDAMNDQARCMRQLQDEACRMGAQVIWGVRREVLDEETAQMRATAAAYQ